MSLVRIIIFIFFVEYCYCIAEEYYNDDYNYKDITMNNISDARRFVVSKDHGKSDIISENSFSDDDFKIFVVGKKSSRHKLKYESPIEQISSTTLPPANTSVREVVNTDKVSTTHFFKEYEYLYDDNVLTTRNETLSTELNDITELLPNKDIKNNNVSSVFLTDFYNIEPAAIMPDLNQSYISLTANKVWYVPEQYPCWKLPVLYGELGRRRKTSDIFLIYDGRLKNVIDLDKSNAILWYKDIVTKPVKNQMHNKWCGVEPCYGDHTLCLFPDNNIISNLCDSRYKVDTPTMIEQIALINTVNTMRNRIAKGICKEYPQLPPAANMNQFIYDLDLEKISAAWLRQCLPGPAACSALDGNIVTQLECTKYSEKCCLDTFKTSSTTKCIPKEECFVSAIIGCIYAWFLSAGHKLHATDVECGFTTANTYSTSQIIWAETKKMGCAVGERNNGDIRVVCNFAPGAPFFLATKYYCGVISHQDITSSVLKRNTTNVTDLNFLRSLGVNLHSVYSDIDSSTEARHYLNKSRRQLNKKFDINALTNLYRQTPVRDQLGESNGTKGMIARLVTKYTFYEETGCRCDTSEPIYTTGEPGSLCVEKGRRFEALCFDFRDPTPGYRLVAVVAPVALFSLILYDLFSGVVRQTNY